MDLSDYWKVAFGAFITLIGIALPLAISAVKKLNNDYSSKNVTKFFWRTSVVYLVLWIVEAILICANFLFPNTSIANCPWIFRIAIVSMLVLYFCFMAKIVLFQENPLLVIRRLSKTHPRFVRRRDRYYHRKIKCFLQKRTLKRWFSSAHNQIKKYFNRDSQKSIPQDPITIPEIVFEELDNTFSIPSSSIERTDRILLAITDVVCYAIRHKQYDVYSQGRDHIKNYMRTVLESKQKDSYRIKEQKIREICEAIRTINSTMCSAPEHIETEMAANAVLMLKPFLVFFNEHDTLCKTLWFMLSDMLKNNRTVVIELSENHLWDTITNSYQQYSEVWNILLIFNSLILEENRTYLALVLKKKGIGRIELFQSEIGEYLEKVLPTDEHLWWYREQSWKDDDETEKMLCNRLIKYYHYIKDDSI